MVFFVFFFLFWFFCLFVCLFVFYEKKREDNEGGNFQIRLYGKLESRKWLPYRHLEMQINLTNIHWKVSWASRKVFGAPRGRKQRKRNRSSGHMSSSALGAESASLIPRLGFYIHLGRGGWRLSHLKQNIESGIPSQSREKVKSFTFRGRLHRIRGAGNPPSVGEMTKSLSPISDSGWKARLALCPILPWSLYS